VKTLIQWMLAASLAGGSGIAMADVSETKGGIKIKTEDGRFEATIGGRIHLDTNLVDNDTGAIFGSNALSTNSTVFFRRARISFGGKAYGWEYLFVPDFAQSAGGNQPSVTTTSTSTVNTGDSNNVCEATPCTVTVTTTTSGTTSAVAFQEAYIARELFGGKIFIGQFKPFRAMEELTSSNEITFMERPWTTATGMYGGGVNRQFVIGTGWQTNYLDNGTFATSVYNLRRDNTVAQEGVGTSTRVTYAPLMSDGAVLHLGTSFSIDNPHNGTNVSMSVPYAGRRGPSASLNATANSRRAMHYSGELAGVFGPFYFQGEYTRGNFDGDTADTDGSAAHFQVSYNITGESKPYDNKKAVFKNIKPNASWGAVELKTRFDYAKNDDAAGSGLKEVRTITAGANYYVNPNVRFMLDYLMGGAERADGQKDKPKTLAARVQMNW
jgi:phosphate-selective porin OprO and OprP